MDYSALDVSCDQTLRHHHATVPPFLASHHGPLKSSHLQIGYRFGTTKTHQQSCSLTGHRKGVHCWVALTLRMYSRWLRAANGQIDLRLVLGD